MTRSPTVSRAVSIRIGTSEPAATAAAGDLEPADVGQPDVEDHALDARRVLGDLEPGPAIGRELDDMAIVLEQALEEPGQPGIVLDDEQVHRGQPSGRSLRLALRTVVSARSIAA